MKLNVDDAVRYMGAGKGNDEIRKMTAAVAEELEKTIRPRYTWRESAETTSPAVLSARHTARSLLPDAVVPSITISFGSIVSPRSIC